MGQLVRLGLLLGMAAYADRKIGRTEAKALLAASAVVAVLAVVVTLGS
ncbi:MAG: hypothetical protein GY698_20040 [Actinomycetia bacterium]|nr:hypothetical protein [Actinomycetes bacterium]